MHFPRPSDGKKLVSVEWTPIRYRSVIVANPRNLRMISESDSKNDPADARLLARLAHVGPELLSPIQQRSRKTQEDLTLVRAREVAVQCRTKIVNAVRGIVKSTGHRLPASSTLTFARKAKEACPEALQSALCSCSALSKS